MELGKKIKLLRLRLGLTQGELADRCELTKGYISQLENDLTSPSIATFIDILDALGTTPKEFFTEEEEEQVVFSAKDFITKNGEESDVTWLVPNSQKNEMEPILIRIRPHGVTDADMPHEGEEFGYVLRGSVTLHIGKRTYTVKRNEVFYFVSDKPHYLENKTGEESAVLWIASPPNF